MTEACAVVNGVGERELLRCAAEGGRRNGVLWCLRHLMAGAGAHARAVS